MTSSRSRRNKLAAILAIILITILFNTSVSAVPTISVVDMPSSAEAGQAIHVEINITSLVPISDLSDAVVLYYKNPGTGQEDWIFMVLAEGNMSDGTWSCDIPAQPWSGELRCDVTAMDVHGDYAYFPASGYHVIALAGEKAPKPFPWNIAIIVCFLAVAFIFTELAFKPGLYRTTGRDKARKLEEEDRLREEGRKEDKGKN